jgi:SAM-dependent methyltransferase
MSPWDHPQAAVHYEAFCGRHSRYIEANAALVAHARIGPEMSLLDVAAGTGRTAEATLPLLGKDGRVLCMEPSATMRMEGMRRLTDKRVVWRAELPNPPDSFDRIVCGAAIWQLRPVAEAFATLARLLRAGGALCFNIPALYLQEPDESGGGSDPSLLSLPALLHTMSQHRRTPALDAPEAPSPLSRAAIEAHLSAAGLRADSWRFRVRITQEAYAAWLKIPAAADGLLGGLSPEQRAQRITSALGCVDRTSWKWEHWCGWTAWKH